MKYSVSDKSMYQDAPAESHYQHLLTTCVSRWVANAQSCSHYIANF